MAKIARKYFPLGVLVVASVHSLAQTVDHPLKATDAMTPPRLIKYANPKFPRNVQETHAKYVVIVHLIVDEKGQPANLSVKEPCEVESLNKAALDAVKKYRFAPAFLDGRPVAVELNVQIDLVPFP